MPTPFMHLQLSESLQSIIVDAGDAIAAALTAPAHWPDFYLGSVAPDYQTICGMPRRETHFYGMSPEGRCVGITNLLAENPQLSPGRAIGVKQATFMAGYLVHLFLDLKWHFDVVLPYFIDNRLFDGPRSAFLSHFILLAYLDQLALQSLSDSARNILELPTIDYEIPFVNNEDLRAWRDFLTAQMGPGETTKTVEIFSERLQMTPREFTAKLNDREWMDGELLSRVPVADIRRKLSESPAECVDLISAYWYGRL